MNEYMIDDTETLVQMGSKVVPVICFHCGDTITNRILGGLGGEIVNVFYSVCGKLGCMEAEGKWRKFRDGTPPVRT